jgi:hypothetical protein
MADDSTAGKAASLVCPCDELRAYVLQAVRDGLTFHDFEQGLFSRVLSLGRSATELFLQQQGTGDLGPSLDLPDGRRLRRLGQLHDRPLTGVFGSFTLWHICYGSREGQKIDFVPLDNRLQLPSDKPSYLPQDFNALLSTEQPFAQVATALERILPIEQHVDSLERQGRHMAEHVEPYRDAQPTPAAEEGPILVRSADAKGVPRRTAADAPPIKSHDHKRGPKTGRKKQAIVGAVYSVEPLVRTPEEVVAALFREPSAAKPKAKRPRPCNKRVMARLNEYTDKQGLEHDGREEVFAWLHEQLEQRNPWGARVVVNLFDGGERLQEAKASATVPGRQVDVLDLLHVTPRPWEVAGLFESRDSPQAQEQVRSWLPGVLRGQGEGVVAHMRQKGQEKGLKGNAKQELAKACNCLEKRLPQMRYDEYLKEGYPIAGGVIEGACRHYVKDRMERTGMSWKQAGAQAMLELRSVALNGDWEEFQDFYRLRQAEHLYPQRQLLDTVAWPLAV